MGRARSRPRDRSPAGPQSQPPGPDAAARWRAFEEANAKPSAQYQPGRHSPKRNVTQLPYLGPPSPKASPRRGRYADNSARGRTAADLAAQALSSVTGAFGNLTSVPDNMFGHGAPAGSAVHESQLIEAEMRQKQLIASQKQMQLNALLKERDQQRQYARGERSRSRSGQRTG